MRDSLGILQQAYGVPVDVEFTVNLREDGQLYINLVQCRPFQVKISKANDLTATTGPPEDAVQVLSSRGPIIGPSVSLEVDRVIYIVPSTYSELSMNQRYAVASLVGRLTRLRDLGSDAVVMLVGPGRWGTSTPALGVPVAFAEIENVSVIVEVALMHEGLVPDVSLGTHFFNDLVELDMLYLAVSPGREGHELDQEFFERQMRNRLPELVPDAAGLADVVRVVEMAGEDRSLRIHASTVGQTSTCFIS
jgi:hypothetical protein